MRRALGPVLVVALVAACVADPGSTPAPRPAPTADVRQTTTPTASPPATAEPTPRAGPADGEGAYLAVGDSVTFGVGVPDPRRQGFVARLSTRLRAADPPITDTRLFAVPGETASGFLERRLDGVLAAIDELGERIDLVTIGLGANELLRIRRHPACASDREAPACNEVVSEAIDEAASSLDEVVGRIQERLAEAGSSARVVLLAYYNPDVEPIAASTVVGADGVVSCDPTDPAPGLNDRIACVAEERGVGLVDLYAAFLGREDELTRIRAGDVHPNAAGHAVIAEAIAEHLQLP
jgi:lysophospholipase L1-like esterase